MYAVVSTLTDPEMIEQNGGVDEYYVIVVASQRMAEVTAKRVVKLYGDTSIRVKEI